MNEHDGRPTGCVRGVELLVFAHGDLVRPSSVRTSSRRGMDTVAPAC